jgi:hypothetical protein
MTGFLNRVGQVLRRAAKGADHTAVKALYQQLKETSDIDGRSRLVAEIAALDFGLDSLIMKMPYAIELAIVGSRSQLDRPDLCHLCGIIGLAQHDPAGSQTFLEEAIAVAPRNAALRNSLALAYLEGGNVAGALVAFSEALSIAPNFIIAQTNLDAVRGSFLRLSRRSIK